MKQIDTRNAVGHVLCHDITRIVKDVVKDTPFRKGHLIKEEDIALLLSLGKDHLYVWEKREGMLHENEAAEILCALCQNEHMTPSDIREGKIELRAQCDGLFVVDRDRLLSINMLDDIMIACRHTNTPVKKGDRLAGTRVIPLVISEEKLHEAKVLAGDTPLFSLLPYRPLKAGIVTTGSEVFYGRIKDTFTPVLVEKLRQYGIVPSFFKTVPDQADLIEGAISELRHQGCNLILCTGGMSVDPDDLTPSSIRASGAQIVSYGAPALPGAMFLLGYYPDGACVMGLPGCVMYAKTTVFDLILPRVVAGSPVTKTDLAGLGHGGLCLDCPECRFPDCSFGKGV